MMIAVSKGLFWKEFLIIRRESAVWVPMIIVPVVFSVVFPIVVLESGSAEGIGSILAGAQGFFDQGIKPPNGTFGNDSADSIWALLNYFFAPLFVLMPVIFATVIAAYSFAGEKVEGTLENLLNSPLTVRSIAFTKILAIIIPTCFVTWVSIVFYIAVVNIFGYRLFGSLVLLNLQWLCVAILVPLISFATVGLVILVSQRAKTVKSAQSISVVVVFPVIAAMVSQATGSMLLGVEALIWVIIITLMIDVGITWAVGAITSEKLLLN